MAGTSSPQQPQVTHPDATAVGDELEDAQGLHAVSNVEVGVVLALESVQPIGDEDSDDNDDIQQVVAVLPVVDGVHIELHAELRAIDGHKDQLGDLRGGGCRRSEGQAKRQSPIVPRSPCRRGPTGCVHLSRRRVRLVNHVTEKPRQSCRHTADTRWALFSSRSAASLPAARNWG